MLRAPIITAFLFCALTGYGQRSKDSALIDQQQAAFRLTNTNPDSAFAIGVKGLELAQRSGNIKLAAYAYKTKGWAFFRLGNYDSSFSNQLASTRLFIQLNDTVEIMYNYLNLANVYAAHSQFIESARYLMLGDSIAKIKSDLRAQAGIKKQMGMLYREQGKYNIAIPYFKESMKMYLLMGDTLRYSDAVSSLSITYNKMSKPDSNIALLQKCASLLYALKGYSYQKAMLSEEFGETYFALASWSKALENYKKAYDVFVSDNNSADMAYEAINIGKTYKKTKNYKEAEKYLLQAYRVNDSLKMTHYAHDAAMELSTLYKETHDWEKGLQWMETTKVLDDSLNLTEQNEKTAELQAKYETERKDKEISLLRKDQELNLLTLQRQETFKYGAVILLALLALIGFLIINRYRIVQKAKRQIEMEKLRNDIARDLHDDMGSALSSINIISKVVLENPGEKENIHEHLKKIKDNSGYMLESISDIVWAINPANDSFEKVFFKMKEFAADILEPLNIQYEFIQSGDPQAMQLGIDKRKDLYLIFKEAINNAAKYSQCTKVTVNIGNEDGEIKLQVTDNGKGFNVMNGSTGNGLRNIKQRAAAMNGTAVITSEKGLGTSVLVKIKSHD